MVRQIPNFKIKVINNNNVKIDDLKGLDYRILPGLLKEQEYTWYSYKAKQNKGI